MAELHFEPHRQRPGAMTQHLRALQPVGPKVLRVAWVRGGRIIDERVLREQSHVTVGENEKNVFVVANSIASLRLFERSADGYTLKLAPGAKARVVLSAGSPLLDLDAATSREVRLTGESRGRVRMGQDTFLFQFVLPPPPQPKPQLPVAVIRGATEIDIATTTIAALSFLLHFLAVGALYSDWLDPVVDDRVVVSGLLADVSALPAFVEDVETPTTEASATDAPTTKPGPTTKTRPGKPGPNRGPGNPGADQDAALSDQLAQIELATLGQLDPSGTATEGVLKDGEVPTGALDEAAASQAGVSTGGFNLPSKGGPVRPGQNSGLASLANTKRGTSASNSGEKVATKGPTGSVGIPPPTTQGGIVSDAPRVVAGMRPGFRNCYNRGLLDHPDAQGSIRLTIRVGPGGEVQGVGAAASGNLPSSIVSCVRNRASAGQFSPPKGGSAVVIAPVSLVKLNR